MTTLKDDIVADVVDVILDTDEFADEIDYYAGTSPKKTIKAVVIAGNDISEDAQRDGLLAINEWRILIASSAAAGVVTPKHGDRIKLGNGKTVIVVGRDHNGFGAHQLMCQEIHLVEKSSMDYRITR